MFLYFFYVRIKTFFLILIMFINGDVAWSDWIGGQGMGGERIHPRQNKRNKSLLNTLQKSSRQDSKGETVWQEVVVKGYRYRAE